MKSMKNIKLLMAVGLLLHVDIGFARDLTSEEAQRIEDKIKDGRNSQSNWKPSGPTAEDIIAATRVDNLAAQGSLDEKIIHAVKNGDHKSVEALILAGAGLKSRNDQDRTALMIAAEKGYSAIAKRLLDAGADVTARDKFGSTALFMAVDKNHVETVRVLIAHGAALDRNFKDIFITSVYKDNVAMVQALVGEGTHINCDTINQASQFVRYGNTEMIKIIKHLKSQCNNSEIND